jgi:hypothetical protein
MPSLRKTNPHLASLSDEELCRTIAKRAISSSRFEGARFSKASVSVQGRKVSRKSAVKSV